MMGSRLDLDFAFAAAVRSALALCLAAIGAACEASPQQHGPPLDCETIRYEYELHPVASPVTADLLAFAAFGEAGVGIAVGAKGTIVRVENSVWTKITSEVEVDLHAVAVFERYGACEPPCTSHIIAVGEAGTVRRSVDGGLTWTAEDLPTTATLRAIIARYSASPYRAVVVGDGVIFHSLVDETWVPATLPPGVGILRGIVEDGYKNRLLAVGDGGWILRSDDDGSTWTTVDAGITEDLIGAIYSPADGRFTVVTAGGRRIRLDFNGAVIQDEALSETVRAFFPGDDYEVVWALYDSDELGPMAIPSIPDSRLEIGFATRAIAPFPNTARMIAVGDAGKLAVITSYVGVDAACFIAEGRPFVVDAVPRTSVPLWRDDWIEAAGPPMLPPDRVRREALASAWARDAAGEHASIASFARFILDLLACGAPPELVQAAQQAAADEIRHAQRCYGLASHYAGRAIGPGPLAIDGALVGSRDVLTLITDVVREGCINETIAAVIIGTRAALCSDPVVRAVLLEIAADEAKHAALAWRTLAWALEVGGPPARAAAMAAFHAEPTIADDPSPATTEDGRLDPPRQRAVARAVISDIVRPTAQALCNLTAA